MSNVQELVELEAAIAEAELADAEGERVKELVSEGAELAAAIEQVKAGRELELEPEPEPEPAAAPVPAFKVDEKKVEKEIERHLTRLAELLGPEAEAYEPCEACGAMGILIPGPKMKPHEDYRACGTCDGYGQVLTGSKAGQYVTTNCPTCMGRGYQERVYEQEGGHIVQPIEGGEGGHFGTPAWMGDPNVKPNPPAGWR